MKEVLYVIGGVVILCAALVLGGAVILAGILKRPER